MQVKQTPLGCFQIGSQEAIFRSVLGRIEGALSQLSDGHLKLGLSGGSTPKAFYQWLVNQSCVSKAFLEKIVWMVSDERCVPLDHPDSNFGALDRLLLQPLGVDASLKRPWPVGDDPLKAAALFEADWQKVFGGKAFDICFLGMGEDAHMASLFPHCPLIGQKNLPLFSAVEWPGKGWRLTITEEGLARSESIVVLVFGQKKMDLLHELLTLPFNPSQYPVHALQPFAHKVLWLLAV